MLWTAVITTILSCETMIHLDFTNTESFADLNSWHTRYMPVHKSIYKTTGSLIALCTLQCCVYVVYCCMFCDGTSQSVSECLVLKTISHMLIAANWEYRQLGRYKGSLGAWLGDVACSKPRNLQPFQELSPNICRFQGTQLVQGEDSSDGWMYVCVWIKISNVFNEAMWVRSIYAWYAAKQYMWICVLFFKMTSNYVQLNALMG